MFNCVSDINETFQQNESHYRGHISFTSYYSIDDGELSDLDYVPIYQGFFHVYESVERDRNTFLDRCIFTSPSQQITLLKESYRLNYGKELLTHMEVSSWEVLVNLVISNVGAGFFPDYLANVPYRKNLLWKSAVQHDPIPYTLVVAKPKGQELSKNGKLLLRCLTPSNRN